MDKENKNDGWDGNGFIPPTESAGIVGEPAEDGLSVNGDFF